MLTAWIVAGVLMILLELFLPGISVPRRNVLEIAA